MNRIVSLKSAMSCGSVQKSSFDLPRKPAYSARPPWLATRVGGAEDWLTHGRDGFLCPAPTVEQLTQSLGEAFAAREQWEAMGWTAAASAARHYRADDYLQLIT